jgi:hypothetical protein
MSRSRHRLVLVTCIAVALSARAASADDGTWTILNPSPGLPSPPNQHVAVFVPSRNQMVAYGGSLGSDTWVLDLSAQSWSKLNVANPPPARLAASAIYDPVRDRMVMFGGYDGGYLDELWTLSLSGTPTWTLATPSGPVPPGRDFASAIYDPVRDRMILFAGFSGATYNDVWALDLASLTWSQLTPSGTLPSPLYGGCAIYDRAGDQMVTTFGGTGQTWSLSLGASPAWTLLHPTGVGPSNRLFATAVYDADGQRMLIHGGKYLTNGFPDTYELTLGASPAWRLLSIAGAAAGARWQHTAVIDPAQHRMILLGGNGSPDTRILTWPPGVPPPSVTSVAPSAGHVGDDVTLYGSALSGATDVQFNGTSAPILSNTGTVVTTVVPTGATTGAVWVETPLGNAVAPGAFTVLHTPEILSFSPTQGVVGSQVVILGHEMSGVTQVSFNTTPASFNIISDDEVDAIVPSTATTGHLTLLNSFGPSVSVGTFTVLHPAPLITSVTPNAARVGTLVVLTGQYLAHVTRVDYFGTSMNPFTIISDTEIHSTVPPFAQTGAITVANPDGVTLTPSFQVIRTPPIITSATPSAARRGATVTIFGQYFGSLQHVSFGGAGSAAFSIVSDNQVTATLDAQATSGPIVMTNADGTSSSTFQFTVVLYPPVITSATPTSGKIGQAVTILGSQFIGTSRVGFGPVSHASYTVISDTEIDAVVDNAAVSGAIKVVNGDGTTLSGFNFTVLPPDGPPRIAAIRDVPNDQGGKVVLEWLASDFDIGYGSNVTDYRVWRRAPLMSATATSLGPVTSMPLTAFPGGFWEPIGDVPAVRFPGYAFTAPTLQDSVPDANVLTAFMIEAITANPAIYYFSNPDSGYSVDNLAPPYPASLIATYSASSARLSWSASSAGDLAEYRIYRGSATPFAPDDAHLLAVTSDTTFVDAEGGQTYELVAIDRHGGRSRVAVVSPIEPAASLVRTRSPVTQPDVIRLSWVAEGQSQTLATLYRRAPGSDWTKLSDLHATPGGDLTYEDRAVTAGQTYGYRLGIVDAGAEILLGELSATAATPRVAIEAVRPNPSVRGACTVDLELLSDQPARLELLDITGRRVLQQDLSAPGPGRRSLTLSPRSSLPAGVYFLRLHQADRSGSLRLVVLE